MKKILCTCLFLSVFVLSMDVHAHPGRTDSNGGHYCRTNCEKWGYEYGEYHYHNGGSSSSSSSSNKNSGSSSSSSSTSTNSYYESQEYKTSEYNKGYEAGLTAGQADYEDLKEANNNALTGSTYYKNGYKKGYDESYTEAKQADYDKGYEAGLTAGKQDYENDKEADNVALTGGTSYKNGYKKGYDESYAKAKQADYYYKLGEEKGYALVALDGLLKDVPTDYQESYSDGHKIGFNRKNAELRSAAEEKGYEDGYNLAEKSSTYEGDLKTAYEDKYEDGYREKLAEIKEEGFNSAYVNDQLVIPKEYEGNDKLATQFTQGFEENVEAIQIKEEAHDDGFKFLINNKVKAAEPYEHATALYDLYYEKGKSEAIELYKKVGKGCGASLTLTVATMLILNRRRRNKSA